MKNNVALLWLHFAMASLCNDMTSLCNGYVAFKTVKDVCFRFHFSPFAYVYKQSYHPS